MNRPDPKKDRPVELVYKKLGDADYWNGMTAYCRVGAELCDNENTTPGMMGRTIKRACANLRDSCRFEDNCWYEMNSEAPRYPELGENERAEVTNVEKQKVIQLQKLREQEELERTGQYALPFENPEPEPPNRFARWSAQLNLPLAKMIDEKLWLVRAVQMLADAQFLQATQPQQEHYISEKIRGASALIVVDLERRWLESVWPVSDPEQPTLARVIELVSRAIASDFHGNENAVADSLPYAEAVLCDLWQEPKE